MSASVHPAKDAAIPAHVPSEKVWEFDYFGDPRAARDPFSMFSDVFEHAPDVFWSPGPHGGWIFRRFEDIREVLQTTELFSNKGRFPGFRDVIGGDFVAIPLEVDPPEHGHYRLMLNPLFAPKRVDAIEADIRETAVRLIDGFKDEGECEFVARFARWLPTTIFVRIMGLPEESTQTYIDLTMRLVHTRDPQKQMAAAREISEALSALIADRLKAPKDDLLSLIATMKIDDRPITDMEILGFAALLFVAGLDTVTSMLSLAFAYLARNPERQQALRENSELIGGAVEEMLRAFSPVILGRTVTKDCTFKGVEMRKGDMVRCILPLANRDAEQFPDPTTVDFNRAASNHIAFASGPHRCLGSHLARRELKISIAEFLQRIPPFRIKAGAPLTLHSGVIGYESLPLEWDVG